MNSLLDLGVEQFENLMPHHIKDLVPNLSERIKFEHIYEHFKNGAHSVHLDDSGRCFDYHQKVNIKTPADIRAIPSIDLHIVIKNYNDNVNSLQNNERCIVGRKIIHHLLVTNYERM